MFIDFSSWEEYEGASEGSGRSEKIWLSNPSNGEIGLFKFPKTEYTTEHISEKIAADIAKLIDIECMRVVLGKFNSRQFCKVRRGSDFVHYMIMDLLYVVIYKSQTLIVIWEMIKLDLNLWLILNPGQELE